MGISKKRLEGLGYFERVDIYASDTNAPGRKEVPPQTPSADHGVGSPPKSP
jgi:hypothetical protein